MNPITASTPPSPVSSKFLFDISGIDWDATVATRDDIARVNPHRGNMALLDSIVWTDPELIHAIARVRVKGDEFWAAGHFPGKPMYPGVLMVECGAQLANYVFNVRTPNPNISALIGVDEARFRAPVEPGNTLYVLLKSEKWTVTRFSSKVQGIVNDSIAFSCSVSGMQINAKKQ